MSQRRWVWLDGLWPLAASQIRAIIRQYEQGRPPSPASIVRLAATASTAALRAVPSGRPLTGGHSHEIGAREDDGGGKSRAEHREVSSIRSGGCGLLRRSVPMSGGASHRLTS